MSKIITKPSSTSPKCIRCALLDADMAKSTHDCWVSKTCPKTRNLIKHGNTYNLNRRKKRIETFHNIKVPEVVYGNLLIWRELRQDSPIHAIGADVWDGKRRVALVEPIHVGGWMPKQLDNYVQSTLNMLENAYGFQKFAAEIIEHPEQCPIKPCPLHSPALIVGSVGGSD